MIEQTPVDVEIRLLREEDATAIHQAFVAQGWHKSVAKYHSYFNDQREGKRLVFVANYSGEFAGYLTLVWDSKYLPFKKNGIPELVDFNVLKKFQRRGVGNLLMQAAENKAAERSRVVGIGFGITADYGAAQRLYAKRGYVPDGRGLMNNGIPVHYSDKVIIGDNLTFYLTKHFT